MARSIDLAVRNVRVLARGAIRALRLEENVPEEVVERPARPRPRRCARSAGRWTRAATSTPCAAPALRAAAQATKVLDMTANMSVTVIVGQIRSTAMDLLTGTGMDADEAAEAVQEAIAAA